MAAIGDELVVLPAQKRVAQRAPRLDGLLALVHLTHVGYGRREEIE